MLQESIEVFKKELREYGDRLITDNYIPKDGTYIIVPSDYSKPEVFEIKYNKKKDEIEGIENLNFRKVCNYDYNSILIDMNKPIDSKKVIHSNNYYTFFIKKESLITKKLKEEIIDNYYDILSDPNIKYTKTKAREIYTYVETDLEEIDQEILMNNKKWIKENIFNLEELGIDISSKDYVKIFFEADIEKYEQEGRRYLIPNVFNNNDYNKLVDGELYGLHNNNMGLNAKKPYLENKSKKIEIPNLISIEEAINQKKFFDHLMNLASKSLVNIYISEDKIKYFKNGNMPDKSFEGSYMRIKKGKEVEIEAYDIVPSYKHILKKPFIYENILDVDKKYEPESGYGKYTNKATMQNLINDVLFSKYLQNNYFTKASDISLNDITLKNNLLVSRDAIFNYLYKSNNEQIYILLYNTSMNLIKNSIRNGYITKASHQFNFRCSIENYIKGGSNMADIISDIKNELREKINANETPMINSDREYYFAVGQYVGYLISKSKSKVKPQSLLNPFINAKNEELLREKLKNLYKKYNYDVQGKRQDNMYAMVLSYKAEGKIDQDMIIAGYLHSNLIYESKDKKEN